MYIAIITNLLRQNQITTKTSRMNVLHPLWVLILGSTLFISSMHTVCSPVHHACSGFYPGLILNFNGLLAPTIHDIKARRQRKLRINLGQKILT